MSDRKAMVCPACGNAFESEVVTVGFIPIQTCPACGPIADIFSMAAAVEKLQADKVWISLSSEPKYLAQALKDAHPDFQERTIIDVLKHVRATAIDGTMSFELPRHIAAAVCFVVKAKHPNVTVESAVA
jgi:hypothetical protein